MTTFAQPPPTAEPLEVLLQDRDGRPVPGLRMRLDHTTSEALASGEPGATVAGRGRNYHGTSDADGRARFESVAPGTYVVRVGVPTTSDLVPPSDNPLVAEPVVTLEPSGANPGAPQQVVVELWPGTRVRSFLELPVQDASGFEVRFRHRETGALLRSPYLRDRPEVERLLAPGTWEVSMEPRSGFVLVALDQDRQELAGNVALLDLAVLPPSVDLTWTYTAPCTVRGAVAVEAGQEPAVEIVASLLEPGPWIEAARRRGGSQVDRVTAGVDSHTGTYEMRLPDGRWSLRPVGRHLVSSRPETVELDLAPGEDGRADFTVRLEEEAGNRLPVRVLDARGAGLRGAEVAAFPADDETASASARATTDRFGWARLEGLADGDLLLVAAHPSHLEGRLELPGFDAERPPETPQVIRLEAGSELRFFVRDAQGEPASGVALEVERLGEPPELRLGGGELAAARQQRAAVTDRLGRASLSGFYPGDYRLRGGRLGEGGPTQGALVRLGIDGGELRTRLDVTLGTDEVVEIEGALLPSRSLQASVVCGDGGSLPRTVDVRLLGTDVPLPQDATGRGDPGRGLLALDRQVLGGAFRDTLRIDFVAAGDYRLALRPGGFDRWSWAYGTHDPARSQVVTVSDGGESEPLALGEIQVECAPAVDLRPEAVGGGRISDLEEVEIEVWLLDPELDEEISDPPWTVVVDDRFEIRGLVVGPTGRGRLLFTLEHPHFLPEPLLDWEVPVVLETGRLLDLVATVELGGAIELRRANSGDATWAGQLEVLDGAGQLVGRAAVEGPRIVVPSLPAAVYEVRWVGAAGNSVAAWPVVEVERGQTTRLD